MLTDTREELADATDDLATDLVQALSDGRITDAEGVELLRGVLRGALDVALPLDAVTDPIAQKVADVLTVGVVRLGRRDPRKIRRRAREAADAGDAERAARLVDRAAAVERRQAERAKG